MENPEDFAQAGKLAARIREQSKGLIRPGEQLLEIAETIEQWIQEEGMKPAFPVNLSIDDIAAHYTPTANDTTVIAENDVVKVDMGIEVDGALSDTAYTVDLSGKHKTLVQAAREALEEAVAHIKPGVGVGEIGGVIEQKIRSYGFKPISNLTGHLIQSNNLHAGVGLPNVKTNDRYTFKAGDIFAVEPFATDGEGFVYDADQVEIFSLMERRPTRQRQSRQLLQHIQENYPAQPFAERWLQKKFPSKMLLSTALKELLAAQAIRAYPVLKERGQGMVTQFEHTVLVEEGGVKVLTR